MVEQVELQLAYLWDCSNCGRENIIHTSWRDRGDGKLHLTPYMDEIASVICKFCGEEFPIEIEIEEEEESKDEGEEDNDS
jgi:transcription elongation factor Elf1